MAKRPEIHRSLGDASVGHLKDMEAGDFDRGYFDAAPEGNYEGSLSSDCYYDLTEDGVERRCAGTKHPGMIEADGFRRTHGEDDEYGFVRRPMHRHDVERN